jgi:hypothetical protein
MRRSEFEKSNSGLGMEGHGMHALWRNSRSTIIITSDKAFDTYSLSFAFLRLYMPSPVAAGSCSSLCFFQPRKWLFV